MPTNAYLPFDLLIEKASDDYRARVLYSPVGQASAHFTSPFDAPELGQFMAYVGLRAPIAGTQLKPEELLKRTGTRLFDAVFREEVLTSYRRSRDAADSKGKGLRVKLRLNDVPELADLPWEYMYDSSRQQFLALSKETPIVRFLELPEPIAPLAAPAPLNLLVVAASPSDYPPLDVEAEWTRLNGAVKALRAANKLTVTRVDPPTIDALRAQLRKDEYHILHFIGHGEYDEAAGSGALLFQDAAGKGQAVNDESLATLLQDAKALRFVLLNACEGARGSNKNPFTGVAARLVQQAIPAVIAMQFPISDPAAIQFSTDIYATLADGYPIDAAVNEARRAIYFNGSVLEWGTPVMFMRADEGMIFEKEREMEDSSTPKPSSSHGGISIGGNAKVSVGRDMVSGDKIVHGDDIITQTAGGADDKQELAQRLADVERTLAGLRDGTDEDAFELAEYKLRDLKSELTRKDGAPDGKALTRSVDSLLKNVPQLNASLRALLETAAARQILAQTGNTEWYRTKFG